MKIMTKAQRQAVDEIHAKGGRAVVWAKPGAGKTAPVLTAMMSLYPSRVLIVATKRICQQQVWEKDAAAFEGLQHLVPMFGNLSRTGSPKARQALLRQEHRIQVITYDLLGWLLNELGEAWPYEGVILDEITKAKTYNSLRAKLLRKRIFRSPLRIGMTGTPRGNTMLGLFSQFKLIGGDAPLGPRFTDFRQHYFRADDPRHVIWHPRGPWIEAAIKEKVRPWVVHLPPVQDVPRRFIVQRVDISGLPKELMDELKVERTITIPEGEVLAVEPHVLYNRLRQLAAGAIYVDGGNRYGRVHSAKLDALDDIIEEMGGEPILVCYNYRHELERLRGRYAGDVTQDIDAWLAGKHQILAAHPASMGHGLNLHTGGCSVTVWLSLPDSWENWDQTNWRLARPGQKEMVAIHALVAGDTIEEQVAEALEYHGNQERLLLEG